MNKFVLLTNAWDGQTIAINKNAVIAVMRPPEEQKDKIVNTESGPKHEVECFVLTSESDGGFAVAENFEDVVEKLS